MRDAKGKASLSCPRLYIRLQRYTHPLAPARCSYRYCGQRTHKIGKTTCPRRTSAHIYFTHLFLDFDRCFIKFTNSFGEHHNSTLPNLSTPKHDMSKATILHNARAHHSHENCFTHFSMDPLELRFMSPSARINYQGVLVKLRF